MNVSNNAKRQPLPVNFETSQVAVEKNGPVLLSYSQPSISETSLGQIPKDGQVRPRERGRSDVFYTDSFRPNDNLELPGYRKIFSDEPYMKDGKPLFKEVREMVHLGRKSGVKEGLLGGLAGTIAGAAATAAVVGLGIVAAPIGLAAAAVLGVGGAALAAANARSEVRELEWVETPIVSHELQGFRQSVSSYYRQETGPHAQTGNVFEATYEPLITAENHGSWMKPVVRLRKS